MNEQASTKEGTQRSRVFVYRGVVPPALALLLVAPLVFIFASLAAVLLAGGTLAAVVVPFFLRRKRVDGTATDAITLERDQYSRVDPDAPRLPRGAKLHDD